MIHQELSEYEKLREINIRERDEAMKEAMEGIEEAKQDMRDNAPGAKKRTAEEESGVKRKTKNVEPALGVRRSGRERKLVSYVVEEDCQERTCQGFCKVRSSSNHEVLSHSPPTQAGGLFRAS